jgi:hypothetical protein
MLRAVRTEAEEQLVRELTSAVRTARGDGVDADTIAVFVLQVALAAYAAMEVGSALPDRDDWIGACELVHANASGPGGIGGLASPLARFLAVRPKGS